MKKEFKGTKGNAKITTSNMGRKEAIGIEIGNWTIADVFKDVDELLPEYEANANLICEAFNVVNECGLTPRQLAEQNKELLGILSKVKSKFNGCKFTVSQDMELTYQIDTAINNAETI